MSTQIKGAEYPLAKIFSSDFAFRIPSFQRPYAWTTEEAGELFDDLWDFYSAESEEEQYFLGSIVLVKEDGKPSALVIDGQQRLTTLTILFAALAAQMSGKNKELFKTYIYEPGNIFQHLDEKPRLSIREKDNSFLKKYLAYVLEKGMDALSGIEKQKKEKKKKASAPQNLNPEELEAKAYSPDAIKADAQANIVRNSLLFYDRIAEKLDSEKTVIDFSAFLIQRCFLVAVSTPTPEAAFRVFSVMNNRGLDLLPTDIIKADVIGKVSPDQQDHYTGLWETLEAELGRNGFNDLFSHIRTIYAKTKAKKAMVDEFKTYVLPGLKGPDAEKTAVAFLENTLEPYAKAYRVLTTKSYAAVSGAEAVNDILNWLNRIDNSDWLPPAMRFYVKHQNESDLLNLFFRRLERLAAYMRATSLDVTHRIERYGKVMADMESAQMETTSGGVFGPSIELTKEEKQEFLDRLQSDMYRMVPKKRNYLILRLDSFVSDSAAVYNYEVLTIEHVLPQTVQPGSEWEKQWPNPEERAALLHKIGNLIPLAKWTNSAAQNYEFPMKKEKYFKGKNGTSTFALATQVLNCDAWMPETVKKRQKELIDIHRKNWDL